MFINNCYQLHTLKTKCKMYTEILNTCKIFCGQVELNSITESWQYIVCEWGKFTNFHITKKQFQYAVISLMNPALYSVTDT